MAFPNIRTDLPVGTQTVSTIDNEERTTRSYLVQCMEQISDYPYSTALVPMLWTTDTRPTYHDKPLMGYNTDTGHLEIIRGTDDILDTAKASALAAHPIGEFYYTDNADFDPNTEWGGTWTKQRDGRVIISETDSHPVGSTGGSESVAITLEQSPGHTHSVSCASSGSHHHGVPGESTSDGRPHYGFYDAANNHRGFHDVGIDSDNAIWNTSTDGAHSHTITIGSSGGGKPHNNMQPYRAAYCWHRDA